MPLSGMGVLHMLCTTVTLHLPFVLAAQERFYETNVLVETIAGSAFYGYVDGQGAQTMFAHPSGITVDANTNVYVWDNDNQRIRKITPDGLVTTLAGHGGERTIRDGVGTNACFYVLYPYEADLVAGPSGSIYFANLDRIRKISADGIVSTLQLPSGFSQALGLAVDAYENIYVADSGNNRIKKISPEGEVTVIAGSGNNASVDGKGIFSSFAQPYGITVDPFGNIYVGQRASPYIRRITPDGTVTTFAGGGSVGPSGGSKDGQGTNSSFQGLMRLGCDAFGNVYVGESGAVRKITPDGRSTTIAGGNSGGFQDGEGRIARFATANLMTVGPGNEIYIADTGNNRIRRISFQPVPVTEFAIARYAGLSVIGLLGRDYRIEFKDSLGADNWTTAAVIRITNSPQLWFDINSATTARRFYRSVLLPP